MTDERQTPPQGGKATTNETGGAGPGAGEAGLVWIILLVAYLVLFTVLVIYSLVKIWPVPTPSRENPPTAAATPSPTVTPTGTTTPTNTPTPTPTPTATQTPAAAGQRTASPSPTPAPSPSSTGQPTPVTILWWDFKLWDEQILLLLVILGGALGTLVHCLRSVYWYIGERSLVKSWMAMYFMMPFAGAALALVF